MKEFLLHYLFNLIALPDNLRYGLLGIPSPYTHEQVVFSGLTIAFTLCTLLYFEVLFKGVKKLFNKKVESNVPLDVTWNSLSSDQRHLLIEMFGAENVHDFKKIKAGEYPLDKAIYFTVYYMNAPTKYVSQEWKVAILAAIRTLLPSIFQKQ